jgi:pullulanase
MTRSFCEALKFSVPTFVAAALLAGCGSGGGGSADLDQGGSVSQPPLPVSSMETFDFDSATDWFVSGTPPTHARFSGGTATDTGAGSWIIPSGKTGVVEFGTPADAVSFSTQDDFTAGTGAGAQKTGASGQAGTQAVKFPYDTAMYLRGSMNSWLDGGVTDQWKLVEVAENVKALSVDLVAGTYAFKIASETYVNPANTNCGQAGASGVVAVGTPYTLNCADGSGDLSITLPKDAKWKFTLDVTGADQKLIVAEDTGGGGGGGEPEPEEDSTVIRVHYVTVVATRDGPAGVTSVEETKGLGSLSVNVARKGGESRVYKVEIQNLGTNGDIGITDFAWTSDAQFALATQQVDIYYTLPPGSGTGQTIVVGGETYPCVAAPAGAPYSCVASNVDVTPYANATMTVRNADGSTRDTIIFNGGSGAQDVYAYSGSTYATTGTPAAPPALADAAAHWVNADTLLYDPPAGTAKVELLYSPDASIATGPQGLTGTYQTIALTSGTNPQPVFNKQLHSLAAWSLGTAAANAKDLARGQLVAVGRDSKGAILAATFVQAAGALDALYAGAAYDDQLGVTYTSGAPSLAVWAPTALEDPGVSVNLYDDPADTTPQVVAMTLDDATGSWSVAGTADWDRKFYTISLRVYSYAAKAIVNNEVTDPYSVSLAMDSKRSQFVNLDDADLKPAGWDSLELPALAAPEDSVLYELHVRDFSIADTSVPVADRGKFTAFDIEGTDGRNHLRQLAQAGLTHAHILPAFDIATVRENPDDRVELDDPVEELCAKNTAANNLCVTDPGKTIRQAMQDAVAAGWLTRPQEITNWMRQLDGFNWGYDPYHFGVPEGSYSTDPNGATRIREFRRMVKGLNDVGLRTVMDVVYNHTNESGQNTRSVLDKLVPGYYYRRDVTSGTVTKKSCCDDTATEFRMMEKLMIDTGVSWVRDYKVSGFRFDLMSMHPLAAMTRFRDAVKAVEPTLYLYGEGWNCCGVENDQRFVAARQANLKGTGIGSFSDRIRDPLRGGGPFDSGTAYVKNQGFTSGWYYDPNSENSGSAADREALTKATDNIRVWLAGGLADYQLQNYAGVTVTGAGVDYGGQPSGYTADPQEAINYVEKHDNQTLWDLGAYKHPDATSLADRVRAQNVGLAVILLGQGVPFVHAGSELLRSKSGDRDSYDSGDWFNELDWTLSGTKWAQGLPVDFKNSGEWPILESKYRTVPRPDAAALQRSFDHVREMLQIRKSSGLFRLRDAAQVKQRVKFYNTGPSQIPGLVAMGIDGCTNPGEPVPDRGALMVLFNASDTPQTLALFGSEDWTLHEVLADDSTDPVVSTARHDEDGFYVPARTTAVFERSAQRSCAPYAVDMFVRGSFNDWGNDLATRPNYRLQFLGGTRYSLTGAAVTLPTSGLPEFKIADANWVAATNCGGTASGQTVLLGQPSTLRCGDGTQNLRLNASAAGNYTFSLDAASTVNPVLTVTRTSPSNDQTVFVRGLFGDWGTTRPMTWDGESYYSAVVNAAAAGGTGFKIATSDWATLNCGGPVGASDSVTIGEPYTLACGDGTSNLSVNFPASGDYVMAVDATNQATLRLTIEPKPVDVFVRGINGDWSDGAQNRMSYLGFDTYRIDRAVAAGPTAFKIASSDWSTVNCGHPTAGQEVAVGTMFTMTCPANENLNLTAPSAGTYRFKYTAGDNGLLITGP